MRTLTVDELRQPQPQSHCVTPEAIRLIGEENKGEENQPHLSAGDGDNRGVLVVMLRLVGLLVAEGDELLKGH